ncbi:MAG: sigma-54-dependent Fis family transcriptional regulator [Deltaproteobacteria bacterium]|nr:sigma-54-dependent Fis family transcriptional regulator [Deltaproteobacteria bacterium]
MARSVLIVDDDPVMLKLLARGIGGGGYEITTAPGGPAAVKALDANVFDALLVDLGMPEIDGFAVMAHALRKNRTRAVIVITGQNSVPVAVAAMRAGAADFLTKPVEPRNVLDALSRTLGDPGGTSSLEETARTWRRSFAGAIVGEDPSLLGIFRILERVADTDCSVFITGESGTGKELIARALHEASHRAKHPFVAVNCAAIPKELMESEVFGHVKGAFTGALAPREGRLQVAEGGTLFLDEIGEMDVQLQSKFLRVIQEREYTPVGESRARTADVRIVAATNQDIKQLCQDGRFRNDLFYRLNVIPIELSPLRSRRDDIPLLAQHFLARANNRHNRSVTGFADSARQAFLAYGWPGNVREMANIIERLVILKGHGLIDAADLPPPMQSSETDAGDEITLPDKGLDINDALIKLERRLTLDALHRCGGNKAKAAELLGLKRTTLIERLKRLDIQEPLDGNVDSSPTSSNR